jgi:predicted nucleic acid-binding protein
VSTVYLLDNNVISVAVRPDEPRHGSVVNHLRAIGSSYIFLPTMAVAEIQDGMARVDAVGKVLPASALAQRASLQRFFNNDYGAHFPFDDGAIEAYSLIRSRLWVEYSTKVGRKTVEKLPEELRDRPTGKLLGIDERDLIIVCTAMAYGCTLATLDLNPGMQIISKVAKDLEVEGKLKKLHMDDWSS